MATIKLLTQSDLMKAVAELKTVAATVQDSIHVCACSGLDHVRAHGDTTGVVALMNALPNGQRVKALAFWFKKFSNSKLILTQDKSTKVWAAKLSKQRLESDFDVAGAMEITFADLTDERDPQSTTVEGLLKSLVAKSTNSENFDGTDIPKVTPEARKFSAALVAFARANGYDPKAPKAEVAQAA
ncbi:MAG TPA: hypothetical protein VN734_17225 [Acidobacteriaceae bacterium]|nr:hypothetical protein [Acidobacteriaceae bacterium]